MMSPTASATSCKRPLRPPLLRDGDVHLYHTDLECAADRWHLLSADERARARRFVFDRDRVRFVAARAFLRETVAQYIDVPAEHVAFAYAMAGKPYLADSDRLHFNLSHSQRWAVLAVSRRDIGCDVEVLNPIPDLEEVAQACFTENEFRAVLSGTGMERVFRFYTCWTRKEAYIKAIGIGLGAPLKSFEVSVAPQRPARLERISISGEDGPENWSVFAPAIIPEAVVAIVVRRAGARLSFVAHRS